MQDGQRAGDGGVDLCAIRRLAAGNRSGYHSDRCLDRWVEDRSVHAVFVMIKCELGQTYDVANYIVDNIAETSEVFSVSGQWDLLAKFYLQDVSDIGRFICDDVQATPGIRDTFTIDTFNAFGA